jgi:hypothetical protein
MPIMMDQPAISLNSTDVPGPHYKMWKTVSMREGISPVEVVNIIVSTQAALKSMKSALANIIINCHGYEGGYGLSTGGHGKEGFTVSNVGLFGLLRPMNIGPIWLVACQAARGAPGLAFCQKLAVAAGTVVVAGEDDQDLGLWQTYRYYVGLSGQIDDYEGVVYLFYPNNTYIRDIDPEKALWTVKV